MNRIRSIGRLGLLAAWALAAATLSSAPAAITVQDGVLWVYEVNDGGATILHGPGCGDITIPAQLDCYPVTGIGYNAFSGCTGLTSMTLPGSVTYIGSRAFSGCTGLATLCVPVGLAGTTQVADSGVPSSCTVLYGDAWEMVDGAAWSYVVRDGTATVTAGPREGGITIPSVLGGHPVTGIGINAFYRCTKLTSVTIPDSVTSIGSSAFSSCSGLASVTIGNSVTSIGYEAFYGCRGLTSVTIPDSVTSIGSWAFSSCSGLTAVHIHDLAAWCGIEFGDYDANPLYYARHLYLDGKEVAGDLVIPDGVANIGIAAFYSCTNLTSVTIPDSVTSIGYDAFYNCSGLTSVTIGDSVTSIGYYAFYGCSGLTAVHIHDLAAWCGIEFGNWSANLLHFACHLYLDGEEVAGDLVIPDGVAKIGIAAFYSCTNLTSVTIPDSVTSIGDYAFYNCSGLTSVTIGDSVTSIGDYAFSGCSGLTAVHIHDLAAWCGIEFEDYSANPLCYARHLYLDGEEVAGDLVISDGVARIGIYAFYSCTNLTSVTIPDSVTSIGYYAFYNCSGLTSVTIPDSVTRIGSSAFSWCRGLTNMTVGGSVTNIGRGMVTNCSRLATMNVPEAWRSLYVNDSFWSDYAGVPSGCEIVYYAPATPGVTATGVPYGWLEEKAGEALAAAGGDYEAAAKAAAANGRAVWECYVAGLDPGDAEKDFTTAITFEDGEPKVSWDPDLNAGGKTERVYRAWARKSAAVPEEEEGDPGTGTQDGWRDVTGRESSWSEEGWRFFRVGVELPGGARGAGAVTSGE